VYADPLDGCGVPVARDDGWPVASTDEDKLIDRGALCRMADRLAASSTANVHAVLVVNRRGTGTPIGIQSGPLFAHPGKPWVGQRLNCGS
jgi:hypothetical protein